MVKLVIQIPAYNEARTLGSTLDELPRHLSGVDTIEWLLIDDGSTDDTILVALRHGVDHVVRHPRNLGLARAFMTGLSASLQAGADVIVNTDADNQYNASDIPRLLEPILSGRADMTVGARPISSIPHFSSAKKLLQRFGSWVVRALSGVDVADAPSGFRAYSREAALRMNVFGEYTYTLETLIQAGSSAIVVESVPIRVNEKTRPSRLVKSIRDYVIQSVLTIVRIFTIYRPLQTFMAVGSVLLLVAVALGIRFLVFLFGGEGAGHVQSLILAAILSLAGLQLWVLGVLSDIIRVNRRLLEDIQYRVRVMSHGSALGMRLQNETSDSETLETGDAEDGRFR